MATRSDLQQKLEEILGSDHVYFQPPETVKMKYPAIVYHLDDIDSKYASNEHYVDTKRYRLTYITRTPDDATVDSILKMRMCSFDRYFSADNLHHYVYQIYY